MSLLLTSLLLATGPLAAPSSAGGTPTPATRAEDLFWSLPIEAVAWAGDPSEEDLTQVRAWAQSGWWAPGTRIVLDGGGEAFTFRPTEHDQTHTLGLDAETTYLVANASSERALTGTLFVDESGRNPIRLDFRLDPSTATAGAGPAFRAGRLVHHQRRLQQRVPGAAWFRHVIEDTENGLADPNAADARPGEMQDTFELFVGGRAIAENLQLDRLFPRAVAVEGSEPEPDVPLASIAGIEIEPYEWTPLVEGLDPAGLDELLHWIPSDQHVLLTPSFQAFVDLVDELKLRASPLVAMVEASSSSARSQDALEEQLVLSLDGLARLLGPALIERVGITGGDLYMRMGTDLTFLFQCKDVAPVVSHLRSRYAAAIADDPTIERFEADGVEGVADPFRRVSSFFRVEGDLVLVSNSRESLQRLRRAKDGESLADLEETLFFRDRYPSEGETAFLMISDAAIRRWCGPKWRIAASRRLRALAGLLEVQAAHVGDLQTGVAAARVLELEDERFAELGTITLTQHGAHSSVYGSIGLMTPIVELELTHVPAAEARLYERWRDGYARNWSGAFDPIGARVVIDEDSFEGDLTILPLIDNTDYRELRQWSREARLKPADGDPHADSLFHFTLAIDPESPEVLEFQEMLMSFTPGLAPVLGWMSGAVSIFADEDEVWDVLEDSRDIEEAMEDLFVELNDLPIVISIGSNSPLKLAGWMTALRGFVDGSSPGSTAWRTIEDEHGNKYVKISGEDFTSNDEHLLYATLPEALVFALNEETLQRTIQRYKARRSDPGDEATEALADRESLERGWLGESAAMRISRKGIAIFGGLMGDSIGEEAQRRTFANLHILNEWKRLFPDEDPVAVHARVLGQELTCGAGGTFVWDPEWKTMASSVLGHPGAAIAPPHLPPAVGDLESFEAGLTFELDGLRARARATR